MRGQRTLNLTERNTGAAAAAVVETATTWVQRFCRPRVSGLLDNTERTDRMDQKAFKLLCRVQGDGQDKTRIEASSGAENDSEHPFLVIFCPRSFPFGIEDVSLPLDIFHSFLFWLAGCL